VTLYIGVDPGKQGAIAVVDDAGRCLSVVPMPVISGGRGELDLVAIRDLLRGDGSPRFVSVEKLQPLPRSMGGSAANFARGLSRGFEWMLVALGIPYQLVAPQVWQKAMHAGTSGEDTKQRSIVAAQRLFPGVQLRKSERCRKAHDGLCEALLLAEYGRRVRQGGAL
jgi:hypothetical protein